MRSNRLQARCAAGDVQLATGGSNGERVSPLRWVSWPIGKIQPSSMMNFPESGKWADFPNAQMMNDNPEKSERKASEESTRTCSSPVSEWTEFIWFDGGSQCFGWSSRHFHSGWVLRRRAELAELAELRVSECFRGEQSQNTGNCDLVAHSFDGNGLDNRRALCFIIHIISGIIVIIGPQLCNASNRPRVRPWMPRGKAAFHDFNLNLRIPQKSPAPVRSANKTNKNKDNNNNNNNNNSNCNNHKRCNNRNAYWPLIVPRRKQKQTSIQINIRIWFEFEFN